MVASIISTVQMYADGLLWCRCSAKEEFVQNFSILQKSAPGLVELIFEHSFYFNSERSTAASQQCGS